jgi:hypothetical protein
LKILLAAFLGIVPFACSASPIPAPTASATFCLQDTPAAREKGIPPLTLVDPRSRSGFERGTVRGRSRLVYRYDGEPRPSQSQAGLVLPAGLVPPRSYSLEIVFEFLEDRGRWRRILGTRLDVDSGVYLDRGHLQVWDDAAELWAPWFPDLTQAEDDDGPRPSDDDRQIATGTSAVGPGFHHLVVTVSGDGIVNAYVDGGLALTTPPTKALDVSGPVRLFLDGGGPADQEYSDGRVALARVYHRVLTDREVGKLNADPFATCPAGR